MLAPPLRWDRGHGALHDLQERLLHALTRDIAGNRGVVRLAGDLVDLVDIDNPALRPFDVVFRRLQKLEDDVLHILADIARFGQCGGIGHGEGDIEDPRQRLGKKRLAAARGADQQDIRLRQFDVILRGMIEPLVVVVHRNRQHALGMFLPDHIVVQHLADVARRRHAIGGLQARGLGLFADDVHEQFDTFITDEHGRPGDQLAHLMLAFAAEGAIKRVLAVAARVRCHGYPLPIPVTGLSRKV